MKYICQVQDGWMLACENDDSLVLEHTGYPYPDTEASNIEMMQGLFRAKFDIKHSEDWYIHRWASFKNYCMKQISNQQYYIKIDDLYDSFLNTSVALSNSSNVAGAGIFSLPKLTSRYICLYVDHPHLISNLDEFAECICEVQPSAYTLLENKLSGLIFIDEALFKASSKYAKYVDFASKYIKESASITKMVSDWMLEVLDIDYDCLSAIIATGKDEIAKKLLLDNPLTLVNLAGRGTYRGMTAGQFKNKLMMSGYVYSGLNRVYIKFLIAYAEYINGSDYLSDILVRTSDKGIRSGKTPLFSLYSYGGDDASFLVIIQNAVRLSIDNRLDFFTLPAQACSLLDKSIEDILAYYCNISPRYYDAEKNRWILKTASGVKSSNWDILAQKYSSVANILRLEVIGVDFEANSQEVVWDFSRNFDKKLAKIAPYVLLGVDTVLSDRLVSIDSLTDDSKLLELLDCVYNKDDVAIDVIFNSQRVERMKEAIRFSLSYIKEYSSGYVDSLPEDFTDVFGDLNTFAKLLLLDYSYTSSCRDTTISGSTQVAKEYSIVLDSEGRSILVLKYKLSIWDNDNGVLANISEKNFKHISGALLFNFLVALLKEKVYNSAGYRGNLSYFEFDRLNIEFDESTQLVTITYVLDDGDDSLIIENEDF